MTIEIRTVEETGSTNADMLALAAEGAPEGLWLRAKRQQGGRGRMGRTWESPEGNLHCSTIVRLRPGDPPAATLALVAAVAVQDVLATLALAKAIRIKWPNDILAGNAKLCGMLLERTGEAVIVGIGINVTGHPAGLDRPVTSLWSLGAVGSDAGALLELVAVAFASWVERWRAFGMAAIRTAWLERAHAEGTPIRVALPDGLLLNGEFSTLDEDGALILRLENGETRAIHAADIFLI